MSREAELYKDKIEVSLDGRQIFYLFFGGAVIVGLVFVLGVMVGRRVEARGHVDRARVAASVDPLAALDRLEGGNGLSFQGALRGADAPASDVEKQIAAMKADGAIADDRKKADRKDDAAKAEKSAKAETAAKAETSDKAEKSEKSEKPAKADKTSDEVKAERKKTDDEASDSKQKDDARKSDKSDGTAEAKATTDEKSEKKKFTLQLSSFQDKQEAEAYLDSIKSAGYSAYVAEANVDGKQYYRVRMGSYKSMDAASEAKAEFEKQAKKSAIITRL